MAIGQPQYPSLYWIPIKEVYARVIDWQMVSNEKPYDIKSKFDVYDDNYNFTDGILVSLLDGNRDETEMFYQSKYQLSEYHKGGFHKFISYRPGPRELSLPLESRGPYSVKEYGTYVAEYHSSEFEVPDEYSVFIDLIDQSKNLDALFSDQSKAFWNNATLFFEFRHLLSKIQLNFPGFLVQEVILTNQPSFDYYILEKEIILFEEGDDITMLCEDGKFTAILAPSEVWKDQSLIINTGDKNLTIPLQEIFSELRSGCFYNYSIILDKYFITAKKNSLTPFICGINAILDCICY